MSRTETSRAIPGDGRGLPQPYATSGSYPTLRRIEGPTLLVPPAALGWTPPFTISRQGAVYTTNFDIAALKPPVLKTYNVDPVNGQSGVAGTGWGSQALRDLSAALLKPDVDQIVLEDFGVDGTIYLGARGWNGASPTRPVLITTRSGKRVTLVKALSAATATWTLVSGSVFSTPVTTGNTGAPMDLSFRDSSNLFTRLLQAPSATTSPAAGYYWHDTSGALGTAGLMYVQAPDSRNLVGSTTMIPPNAGNHVSCNISTDIAPTIYIENLDIVGGIPLNAQVNTALSGRPKFVTRNCTFQGSVPLQNGTAIIGPWDIYHQDCVAGGNHKDGFNRHGNAYGNPRTFLHRCKTGRNGYDTSASSNNADTAHESCVSIALACDFRDAQNNNVGYVDSSVGWFVDCDIGPSLATDSSGISLAVSGTSQAYLEGCRIRKSVYLDLIAGSGSTIYVSNTSLSGLTTSGSVAVA